MRPITGIAAAAAVLVASSLAAQRLEAPAIDSDGALRMPDDVDEWVHVGTALGGDYNAAPFDPARPGTFGIVQMEPTAYRYFLVNGQYADGTMFLLTFYRSEAKSDPQLQGFVQGEMTAREIHIIDQSRFSEGSAFFVFTTPDATTGSRMPDGSRCIQCHSAEGDYRATFIQFYPPLREQPRH